MKMKQKVIYISVAALTALAIGGNFMHNIETQKAEETARAEQLAKAKAEQDKRDALIAEFQSNRSSLISESQKLIGDGDPAAAQKMLAKFASLNDPTVTHLLKLSVDKLQVPQTIKKLTDELANKPDKLRAMAIYKELDHLEPSNPLWKAMIDENRAVFDHLNSQRVAADKVAARKAAVKRLFSPWDGSVHVVEQGIKARLKDPDSYKHVETRASDSGVGDVTVVTQYRAKNSFNAVITSVATAVVSPDGELVSLSMK
ncbi:MAG: hypothetical protein FD135_2351 [Comamonadaceae bacterium]|nr:MAG: hypothetical protein FD135_2351 [Comamonadaceae bacterium]